MISFFANQEELMKAKIEAASKHKELTEVQDLNCY